MKGILGMHLVVVGMLALVLSALGFAQNERERQAGTRRLTEGELRQTRGNSPNYQGSTSGQVCACITADVYHIATDICNCLGVDSDLQEECVVCFDGMIVSGYQVWGNASSVQPSGGADGQCDDYWLLLGVCNDNNCVDGVDQDTNCAGTYS